MRDWELHVEYKDAIQLPQPELQFNLYMPPIASHFLEHLVKINWQAVIRMCIVLYMYLVRQSFKKQLIFCGYKESWCLFDLKKIYR